MKETPNVHYVQGSFYPSSGGFASYLRRFPGLTDLRTGHSVVRIEPRPRVITFADGHQARHERVISSIPLPELVPMIDGAPREVIEAAERLACTTCVVVNVGVPRENLLPCHVSYFYDPDISFARVSFPHMLSPHNTPPGHGSIQA